MISNNKISNLVATQLPFFVRNDHENFVAFMEAYYEWMEQQYGVVNVAKSLRNQIDVDQTDIFVESFYKNFLPLIPDDTTVDKTLLLKHVKDFYLTRGTEKSIRFLMRVLFGDEETTFYYPQRDILRASDGKWLIEKSVKIDELVINGVANTSIPAVYNLAGRKITGNTSGATALVEKIDIYYDKGTLVRELKISNQVRDFVDGEQLVSDFIENGQTKTVTANLFSGSINSVQISEGGTGYQVGQYVNIESNTGTGGAIIISSVSSGNLTSIAVYEGGAGFRTNDPVLVAGGEGSGANAAISAVVPNNYYHPNSYNICVSTIDVMANVRVNTSVYTLMNNANANVWIKNGYSYLVYSNTGPISTVILYNAGAGYTGQPTISASANSRVRSMGILGRMIIIDGGRGYRVNDNIYFTNVTGGYGTGAKARVRAVNTASMNAISEVEFVPTNWYPGLPAASANDIIGGTGYDQLFLPTATVVSQNVSATGANVAVTSVLGYGESLVAVGSDAGAIQTLTIVSRGSGYTEAPTLNLRALGDGTAQATATIITGSYTYPGRYINDDGHLSSYNFLENRDYYQKFSYVVKLKQSIEKYRQALKSLIHPTGMKVFGEYMVEDNSESMNVSIRSVTSNNSYIVAGGKSLLFSEPSGMGISFISEDPNLYIKSVSNPSLDYTGLPFSVDGGKIAFTRTSLATVTDYDGKIKWAGHNLLTYSEEFPNAAWTNSNTSDAANTAVAPDGTSTADTITATGTNGTILQSYTANAFPYTFGVWLKRKTGVGTIQIAADSTSWTTANVSNAWVLHTVTQTPAAGSKSAGIRIVTSGDEVYAWGGHLYRSDMMMVNNATGYHETYYPTWASAYHAPRIDYNGATKAKKGLLIEYDQTNLITYSQKFDEPTCWTPLNCTIATSNIASPTGNSTAFKLKENTGTPDSRYGFWMRSVYYMPTLTDGSFSIYAKAGERTQIAIGTAWQGGVAASSIIYDLGLGRSVGSVAASPGNIDATEHGIEYVGDGWYRLSVKLTNITDLEGMRATVAPAHNNTLGYAGDGSSGVYIWGSQMETGLPTSYIPTNGYTIARTADVATINVTSFPYNTTEGTLYVKVRRGGTLQTADEGAGVELINNAETQQANVMHLTVDLGSFNRAQGRLFTPGTGVVSVLGPDGTSPNFVYGESDRKLALAYKSGDSALAFNGQTGATLATAFNTPNIGKLRIATVTAGIQGSDFQGHIKEIAYIPRRMANSEITVITQ